MLSPKWFRVAVIWTAMVCTAKAQVPLVCDSGTVESVRSEFQQDLNSARLGQYCRRHNPTVVLSVNNETAWRHLGCLPELKSLAVAIPTCNNEGPTVTLPAEWGAAASFPNLVELIIEDGKINGTLPAAWGSPDSFPQLVNLTLRGSSFLQGPLPESWGSNGSMPRFKSLNMHANRGNAQGCSICPPVNCPRGFTSPLPISWHKDSFPALETLGLFGFDLIGSLPAEWGCPTCFPNLQVTAPHPPHPLFVTLARFLLHLTHGYTRCLTIPKYKMVACGCWREYLKSKIGVHAAGVSCYQASGPIDQGVIVKVIIGCKAIHPTESEGSITVVQTP